MINECVNMTMKRLLCDPVPIGDYLGHTLNARSNAVHDDIANFFTFFVYLYHSILPLTPHQSTVNIGIIKHLQTSK